MADIEICLYQDKWPDEFQTIAGRIAQIVGDQALSIDHIGSTAVPGLAAKDVIDVQVTVADLDTETVTAVLVENGYQQVVGVTDNLVGLAASSPELRKQFLREPAGERRSHIHIREQGRLNQRYPLLFRDFLRADETVRAAYEQIKIELARRFQGDHDAYYAIKDPHMDTIYRAALLWAQTSNWEPDL